MFGNQKTTVQIPATLFTSYEDSDRPLCFSEPTSPHLQSRETKTILGFSEDQIK